MNMAGKILKRIRGVLGPVLLAAGAAWGAPTGAKELYATDFEDFPVGADQWVGFDGWLGNSRGTRSHGIDSEIVPGLGKTAYLGYYQPTSTFVTVAQPINYSPLATNTPVIEFESLLGIEDSSNGRRDSFYFTVYNRAGYPLASLRFNNSVTNFGMWRWDGVSEVDLDFNFYRGELHLLHATVDYAGNRWSADLDGIPMFADAPFNSSGRTLDLGSVAFEWQLSAGVPSQFGNNWMMIADVSVNAIPQGEEPFALRSIQVPSRLPELGWTAEPGFDYQVQFLESGTTNWDGSLAGGLFTNIQSVTAQRFADATAGSSPARWYRVRRTVAP